MEHTILSRRDLMKCALLAGALPPIVLGRKAGAAPLTPLDPGDATAKALGFVADASKVDARANGTFKSGQHCGACAQYQGKASDADGGCVIFAGHAVPASGWCQAWTQRPG
jgi:hypothetical protein